VISSNPILSLIKDKSQQALGEDDWLTVREVSAILKISRISVYRACSARRITYTKAAGVGIRIDRNDLDRFMESAKIPARTHNAKF